MRLLEAKLDNFLSKRCLKTCGVKKQMFGPIKIANKLLNLLRARINRSKNIVVLSI